MKSFNLKSVQKKFGDNLLNTIHSKGYTSSYDFWVNSDISKLKVSRATLNNIIKGKSDPKLSTILKLTWVLKVKVSTLFDL